MTHSGGKPHAVGDKGQRYEVRAIGYPSAGKHVVGWAPTVGGAFYMATAIAKAPGCDGTEVFDREKQEIVQPQEL